MTVAQKLIGLARGSFTPTSIAGLVAWYDFSDISTLWKDTGRTSAVTADGDAIAGVTDKSGAGLHLSQGTAGNRPLYKTAIINGKSVCRLDGTDDVMQSANWTQAQPYTVIATLAKRSVAVGTKTLLSISTASQFGYMGQHAAISDKFGIYAGTFLSSAVTFSNTTVHWTAGVFNGASGVVKFDATSVAGAVGAGGAAASPFLFGADTALGAADGDYDVGEVLVYSSALSTDLTTLRSYAQTKWGAP